MQRRGVRIAVVVAGGVLVLAIGLLARELARLYPSIGVGIGIAVIVVLWEAYGLWLDRPRPPPGGPKE